MAAQKGAHIGTIIRQLNVTLKCQRIFNVCPLERLIVNHRVEG